MLNGNAPFLLPVLPACPASCLFSSLLAPLAGAGLLCCKVLAKAPFGSKTLGSATARVVFIKQMYSYCQSKANEDCRSQAEIPTSGLTSSQSETRKFILKKKVCHFPTNSQNSGKPSRFLWNTRHACGSPTKRHWQATPAQVGSPVHDCSFSACNWLCHCPCAVQITQIPLNAALSFGGKLHSPRHSLGAHFPAGKCKWTSCGARRKCPASILSHPADMASFYRFAARGPWGCRSLQGSPDLWCRTL